MIEINVGFYMDTNFVDAVEEAFLEAQEEYELARINDLYTESVILFNAYTTGSLVLEDVKIGATSKPIEQKIIHGSMNRISNYFKRILKFLKELSDKFMESISNVFKDGQEWINDNRHYLENIPEEALNTMTLTCVPYWEQGAHARFEEDSLPRSAAYASANTTQILESIKKLDQKRHEENAIYQEFFADLYKLDNKSIKKAAFIYYRGGQPTSKQFEKAACKDAIEKMSAFLLNHNRYQTKVKACQDAFTKDIEKLEEELEEYQKKGQELGVGQENLPTMKNGKWQSDGKTTTNVESLFFEFDGVSLHSDLEGASLFDTEFADMMYDTNGYKILMEAGTIANSPSVSGGSSTVTTGGGNSSTASGTGGASSISPNDNAQNAANIQTNTDRLRNSIHQTATNACIQYCKMGGTVFSVKLSVFREITDHYVNTCKQVVDAVKKYQGVLDEEKENKEYNKQQEMNKDKRKEEMVADNIRRRQIRNANKGTFRRIWSNFFGS